MARERGDEKERKKREKRKRKNERGERNCQVKRGKSKKKKLDHSTTIPSYIWDRTVAKSKKKNWLFPYGLPVVDQFLGLYAKCTFTFGK